MILHQLNTLNNGIGNIKIDGERITAVYKDQKSTSHEDHDHLYFEDSIAFPGLINSHDHLDFNLFPQLGNYHYKNYLEWGNDIHRENKEVIRQILTIPKALRVRWGLYKNLLNGITTVVQHGEKFKLNDAPINIFNQCHSLHSVHLEKNWKYKLNKPFIPNYPFVIHIGEGTDKGSFDEINDLLQWNLLKRKLIGIHGVAMNHEQASQFEALIWCPDSNYFLLNATAAIDKIKTATKIIFGTDSTVSAGWNIWRQLREARSTAMLTDQELTEAVFSSPATVWKLKDTGTLKENYYADMVVAKKREPANNSVDAFFATNPEDIQLILNRGTIIFFDQALLPQLKNISIKNYSKLFINNSCKYVIGDLPGLLKEIKKHAPECHFPIEVEA